MDLKLRDVLLNASIEDLEKGYKENGEVYKCIICGEEFIKGRIHVIDNGLYEARKSIELHVENEHGNMLEYLLGINASAIGLSDMQKQVLKLTLQGLSDTEISEQMDLSKSIIKNCKYKLGEKEKHAKVFLAIMNLANKSKCINKLDMDIDANIKKID